MNILVACEFSGIVRDAFRKRGHNAWSCDLLPSEKPGQHIQWNVLDGLACPENYLTQRASTFTHLEKWDMMIAFPPCTHLAVSGARWFKDKQKEQAEALEFVRLLLSAPIPLIALENPIGVISTKIRKPDQIIQPWQFGDEYQKATCLWLKGLPPLVPTHVVGKGDFVIHGGKKLPKWYSNRERNRSITFSGIAEAMASQWGSMPEHQSPSHAFDIAPRCLEAHHRAAQEPDHHGLHMLQ